MTRTSVPPSLGSSRRRARGRGGQRGEHPTQRQPQVGARPRARAHPRGARGRELAEGEDRRHRRRRLDAAVRGNRRLCGDQLRRGLVHRPIPSLSPSAANCAAPGCTTTWRRTRRGCCSAFEGYDATIVRGQVVTRGGVDTGGPPGRASCAAPIDRRSEGWGKVSSRSERRNKSQVDASDSRRTVRTIKKWPPATRLVTSRGPAPREEAPWRTHVTDDIDVAAVHAQLDRIEEHVREMKELLAELLFIVGPGEG